MIPVASIAKVNDCWQRRGPKTASADVDRNRSFPPNMSDFLRDVISLNAFTPRYMVKTAFELMLQSTDTFKRILPESSGKLAWQEFQNKLQAFYLFEYVDSVLGLSPGAPVSLAEMIGRTFKLEPFLAPWATEGIGHYYTHLQTSAGMPRDLIGCDRTQRLPPESMVPLHTGMGLALAQAAASRRLGSAATAELFVQLCQDNACPEFLGATLEALGLVVRNLYPDLMGSVSQYLWHSNSELFEYFWHGAGRGIYFAPINFLPYLSRPWQGYEMCVRETPNDVARQNAVAGFAWAMTLVNLRHPVILAAFLEQHGERLAKDDAFSNGIFSALVIWRACAPTETSISDLLQYQPDGSNPHHLWETQVRRIAEAALHFPQNDMSRVTGLFRYRPLAQSGMF